MSPTPHSQIGLFSACWCLNPLSGHFSPQSMPSDWSAGSWKGAPAKPRRYRGSHHRGPWAPAFLGGKSSEANHWCFTSGWFMVIIDDWLLTITTMGLLVVQLGPSVSSTPLPSLLSTNYNHLTNGNDGPTDSWRLSGTPYPQQGLHRSDPWRTNTASGNPTNLRVDSGMNQFEGSISGWWLGATTWFGTMWMSRLNRADVSRRRSTQAIHFLR